jgi:hypothetical protein
MQTLKLFRQFILVNLVWNPTAGKYDKFPVNAEGRNINAHEPSHWMSYEQAELLAGATGLRVGFVITAADPFFCLDIDEAYDAQSQSWSPLSHELIAAFPGAMVEVSASGTGLHIWGSSTVFAPHKCKNVPLHIELYHEGRFVLLGSNPTGNESTDCTLSLLNVIARYFPPQAEISAESAEGYNGPYDDDELIRLAYTSKSAATIFGKSVSFQELWEADADALGKAWPASGREYDASSADAALAQRLAFWTGRNEERMLRLMEKSALKRDKWERADYLVRTINGACAKQEKIYKAKPAPSSKDNVATADRKALAHGFVVEAEVPAVFEGCVYISDRHKVLVPGGHMLKPEQFKVCYGGYVFMLDAQKTTRSAWEAFTESVNWRPPYAHSTCFRPEEEAGAMIDDEGLTLVNTWQPIVTKSEEGDTSKFFEHVAKLLPIKADRDILIAYMAACVQYPGTKFQWAPLLQGVEGNGKTLVTSVLSLCVGTRYTHVVNAQDLGGNGGKFNAWIDRKLLICVEEIMTADKREVLEVLKPLITNKRIEIQGKGHDQFTGDNRANFILCSNYPDAIPISKKERRYCTLLTAQQRFEDLANDGLTKSYLRDMYDWVNGVKKYAGQTPGWQHVNHFMKTFKIPEELDPSGDCNRAPHTSTTDRVISLSIGRVEQEILEAVEQEQAGFSGGFISSIMLDNLFERKKMGGRIPPQKRKQILEELGYVPHPALPGGRATQIVMPDGGKPRLYVKVGHLAEQLTNPADVIKKYQDGQNKTVASAVFSANK